ncbi:LLM class flavin-dependent oxidoreductase [Georgenia ruanii]|uniref:LLM class flavin-dependent oxidoreductase n=1 Tax=Georgenia ruanii TaxID=348442 RepID=A0A7J9V1Q9_9MICO|nr:LLM class flavin-dependent oxidoreductase [Georgenia ruanii]MPV90533.1 LLM class flavin-dependent oxidoreductase [Georgenia ruanii]
MTTHDVEFIGAIESGYPNVPYGPDRHSRSLYVDLPNGEYYDPIAGQKALETQLENLVHLEKLGFDGVTLTEQHNGPIGLGPNSMVSAAWLAAHTDRAKIVVGGPLINAYQSPIRLAEEIALVDTLSKGRLVIGLPMGLGQQYHSLGMNPATARERHAEGYELLTRALTEPGPFTWRGKFFNQNYVNIWPRPAHPVELYLPSGGSLETLQVAARRRIGYQSVLSDWNTIAKTLEKFRDLCRAEGYEPDPRQSSAVIEVHVAETDEIARREYEGIALWNYQNYFEGTLEDSFPPGYTSARSYRAILGSGYGLDTKAMTYDDLLEQNWAVAGSPATVREKLEEFIDKTGVGRLILTFSLGAKKDWLLRKTTTIFAEEVLPHFRSTGLPLSESDQRTRYGYRTALEYAASVRRDVPTPTIVKDGYYQDAWKYRQEGTDARIRPREQAPEPVAAAVATSQG